MQSSFPFGPSGHSRHCLLNWRLIHRHALLTPGRGRKQGHTTKGPYQPIFTHITLSWLLFVLKGNIYHFHALSANFKPYYPTGYRSLNIFHHFQFHKYISQFNKYVTISQVCPISKVCHNKTRWISQEGHKFISMSNFTSMSQIHKYVTNSQVCHNFTNMLQFLKCSILTQTKKFCLTKKLLSLQRSQIYVLLVNIHEKMVLKVVECYEAR